jgi:hypothetical protein
VTDAGRRRFRSLMMDTSSSPREYRDIVAFKVTAFDLIERADRLHILQHYVDFARAHVRHLDTQGRDIVDSETYGIAPDHKPQLVNVFGHLMSQWQREAQWAEKLLRQERAT